MLKKVTIYNVMKHRFSMPSNIPNINTLSGKDIEETQYLDKNGRVIKRVYGGCTEVFKYHGDTDIYKEKNTIYSYNGIDYKDIIIYDEKGQPVYSKEGKYIVEYEYDEYGIFKKQTTIKDGKSVPSEYKNSNFAYNRQDDGVMKISYHNDYNDMDVITLIDRNGNTIYRKDDVLEIHFQYNDKGKLTRKEEKHLESDEHEETIWFYDSEYRTICIVTRSLTSGQKLEETIYQYNRNGFMIYESYKDYTAPDEFLRFPFSNSMSSSIYDREIYCFCNDNGVLFEYDRNGKIYRYYSYEEVEEDSVKLDY